MEQFCTVIVLVLLDMVFISAVSGIVCMSDARCRNMMNVEPDEEAYCQFNFFGVGCCHARKRPVHWTEWSQWGHCSVTCGSGTSSSTRTCTGSGSCSGPSLKTKTCQAYPYHCPVDGYLRDWSDWSTCSQTCGYGLMTRSRTCVPPQYGGAPCSQNNKDYRQCLLRQCPVDGYFTDWSKWSTCSQTCGTGLMTRSRACAPPLYGGAPCSQNNQETQRCYLTHCPVDGYFTGWSKWSTCSQTCGTGLMTRSRACAPPLYGGAPCSQNNQETQHCYLTHCPVDGYFTGWSKWSTCSQTCGTGLMTRSRACAPPLYGGAPCSQNNQETQHCYLTHCPVDGYFTGWSKWSTCSQTCGTGLMTRSRACAPPLYGGAPCSQNNQETQRCYLTHCPVDGYFTGWSKWSTCSQTCGTGLMTRSRACAPPLYGGAPCSQNNQETQRCYLTHCPVDGYLTGWSKWSTCSQTCGTGLMTRSRACAPPLYGGAPCSQNNQETQRCYLTHCPVDGYLRDWSNWSTCSQTCGTGLMTRSRACVPPLYGGAPCTQNNQETQRCYLTHCPVDGYFENWSDWNSCSQTCGSGFMMRTRACVPPQYGGAPCSQNDRETQECLLKHCPGLACPEYETDSISGRNQTCLSEEVCMLQTNPTNITCAERQDCIRQKNMPKSEIKCCEDKQCVEDLILLFTVK
ncbi:properdin isoform X2 [Magallana gigas]|uniref:properdin isoform X2 n=1 Tax=Magallana gigas TaxID=29159 RepID=UPI00333F6224